MVFTNNSTEIPQSNLELVQSTFQHNPTYQVQYAPIQDVEYIQQQPEQHNVFQLGANLGPKLAFQYGWFDNYDWVLRINPDVLIRNSTWIHQTMQDPTVEGIVVNCHGEFYDKRKRQLHTDFFAVRPMAMNKYYPNNITTTPADNNNDKKKKKKKSNLKRRRKNEEGTAFSHMALESWSGPESSNTTYFVNHEETAYKYFAPIIQAGTARYLPDADNSQGTCRIRGNQSSVYHGHDSCDHDPTVCDALVHWEIS
jgi:hypothetical protein